MQFHMAIIPTLPHHLLDEFGLHFLFNIGEDQMGNNQVGIIVQSKFRKTCYFRGKWPFGGQTVNTGRFLMVIGSPLLDHPYEVNHTGSIGLVQLYVDTIQPIISPFTDCYVYITHIVTTIQLRLNSTDQLLHLPIRLSRHPNLITIISSVQLIQILKLGHSIFGKTYFIGRNCIYLLLNQSSLRLQQLQEMVHDIQGILEIYFYFQLEIGLEVFSYQCFILIATILLFEVFQGIHFDSGYSPPLELPLQLYHPDLIRRFFHQQIAELVKNCIQIRIWLYDALMLIGDVYSPKEVCLGRVIIIDFQGAEKRDIQVLAQQQLVVQFQVVLVAARNNHCFFTINRLLNLAQSFIGKQDLRTEGQIDGETLVNLWTYNGQTSLHTNTTLQYLYDVFIESGQNQYQVFATILPHGVIEILKALHILSSIAFEFVH